MPREEDKVTIRIWPPGKKSKGHASLETYRGGEKNKGEYVSFWPSCKEGYSNGDQNVCAKEGDHFHGYREDVAIYNGQEPSGEFKIELYSLAIDKINLKYKELKSKIDGGDIVWAAFKNALKSNQSNCCILTYDLLKAGEIYKLANKINLQYRHHLIALSMGLTVLTTFSAGFVYHLISELNDPIKKSSKDVKSERKQANAIITVNNKSMIDGEIASSRSRYARSPIIYNLEPRLIQALETSQKMLTASEKYSTTLNTSRKLCLETIKEARTVSTVYGSLAFFCAAAGIVIAARGYRLGGATLTPLKLHKFLKKIHAVEEREKKASKRDQRTKVAIATTTAIVGTAAITCGIFAYRKFYTPAVSPAPAIVAKPK